MFRDLEIYFEDFGQFHPSIFKIYHHCYSIIKKRVLKEILTAYHSISFEKINSLSGINEFQVTTFLKDYP
jgi:hypothetical protein